MEKFVSLFLLFLVIYNSLGLETNSKLHTLRLLHMESELLDLSREILKKDEHYDEDIAADSELEDVHDFRKVDKFMKEVKEINQESLERIEEVSGDVIQIFQLKSRLTNDWAPILELIKQSELFKRIPALEKKLKSIQQVLKREAKIKDAVNDILRINDIYKTSVVDIIGSKFNLNTFNPLRPMETYELVKGLGENGRQRLALDTVSEALKKLNTSVNERSILMNVKGSLLMKNNLLQEAEELFTKLSIENPSSRTIQSSLKLTRHKIRNPKVEAEIEPEENETLWQSLCRDGYDVVNKNQGQLKCFSREYPNLKAPVYVEEIHRNPRIFVLRNVFRDAELGSIKEESENQALSQMIKDDAYVYGDASLYAMKHAFFVESFHSALINLTYEGSNVNLPESVPGFLLKNHGPGGKHNALIQQKYKLYDLWDALAIGNVYTFLNDVEEGGGLVFPALKLKIQPEKGAVVFWQFRQQKGPVHSKLKEYVECPVIKGNSWTSLNLLEHYGLLSNPVFKPKTVRTFEDMPGEINFSIYDEYTGVPIPEPEPEPDVNDTEEIHGEIDNVNNDVVDGKYDDVVNENVDRENDDTKENENEKSDGDENNKEEEGAWSLF